MTTFQKLLYTLGLYRVTFDKMNHWANNQQWETLHWCLTNDNLLIQEKAFTLLCAHTSESNAEQLCNYASTCPWQLNAVVYTQLISLLNHSSLVSLKNRRAKLIDEMTHALTHEKIERSIKESDGRELPSDRLQKQLKDHRNFMSRGLKLFNQKKTK